MYLFREQGQQGLLLVPTRRGLLILPSQFLQIFIAQLLELHKAACRLICMLQFLFQSFGISLYLSQGRLEGFHSVVPLLQPVLEVLVV